MKYALLLFTSRSAYKVCFAGFLRLPKQVSNLFSKEERSHDFSSLSFAKQSFY